MELSEIENRPTRALWRISASLMASFLSMFGMMFIDRLYLARYSSDALAAAASAGTLCWAVNLGWITLASMAEIFVAQYNGAKRYSKLGEPVWQMVWLSLVSIVFFLPIGFTGAQLLSDSGLVTQSEFLYFRWNTYFSPFLVLLAALSSFYIGTGKAMVITWLSLLGNSINAVLDPILIFGIKGFVPSLGIKGAAIASGIGISIQVAILFIMVLSVKNRKKYGTGMFRLKRDLFTKCIRVGMPPAAFITFELMGWAIFYWMMAQLSKEHILVTSVCQSILYLFIFFGLGLEKGAAAIAGNLIGAGKSELVKRVVWSGLKLIAAFSLLVMLVFVVWPDLIINWFLHQPTVLNGSEFDGAEGLIRIKETIKMGLVLVALYLIIETFRWMLGGILTAAGDTMFLMISGTAAVWLFMIMPTYFFIFKTGGSIQTAFQIWVAYAFLATSLYVFRFWQGKWKERSLIDEISSEETVR